MTPTAMRLVLDAYSCEKVERLQALVGESDAATLSPSWSDTYCEKHEKRKVHDCNARYCHLAGRRLR